MKTATCRTCDDEFESEKSRPKYCSYECNPKRQKTCSYCEEGYVDDHPRNSSKYCEPSCRRKAKVIREAKRKGKDPPEFLDEQTYVCEHCGNDYTPRDSSQMYCTLQCREALYHGEKYASVPDHLSRTIDCLECGETFRGCIPHGGRSGNHFEDAHDMTTEEYLEAHQGTTIYCDASIWKQRQKTFSWSDEAKAAWSDHLVERYKELDVWNKGLTADDHPSLQAHSEFMQEAMLGENNPFYGKTHTEESRKKMSEAVSASWQTEEYRRNYWNAREDYFKEGSCISEPHQALIDAMQEASLYEEYGFEPEVFVTLLDGSKHPIDIASRSLKVAVEVDGCFYHGCPNHGNFDKLSSDWQSAVERTQERDELIDASLAEYGWTVIRIWEHDLSDDLAGCLRRIHKSVTLLQC